VDWQKFTTLKEQLNRPFVMAHRGSSAILPENTLTAFQRALADGADILETDLRFSKDGQIVLMHDETVDRTTFGHGPVQGHTLSEIKNLSVKPLQEAEPTAESPPSLLELIEMTEAQTPLALELKDPQFSQPAYAEKLVRLLADFDLVDQCIILSFALPRLQAVQRVAPSLAAGWITMTHPSPNHPVEFIGPFWPLLFLNPFYMAAARKLGKIICPLDPTPEPRLGLYLKMGLDVVLTNDPAVTFQALARHISPD